MDAFSDAFSLTRFSGKIAACIVTLTICYFVGLAFHRLFLSPLAAFPGPKIAALTGFYEFYYDFFKGGKFIFEIERMHEVYGQCIWAKICFLYNKFQNSTSIGPIVRVNPHELSIRDPEFYDKLYVSGSVRRTNNYEQFVKGLDVAGWSRPPPPINISHADMSRLSPFNHRPWSASPKKKTTWAILLTFRRWSSSAYVEPSRCKSC